MQRVSKKYPSGQQALFYGRKKEVYLVTQYIFKLVKSEIRPAVLLLAALFWSGFVYCSGPVHLLSPDQKIRYSFELRNGTPGYSLYYLGKKRIGFSSINLVFRNDSLSQGMKLTNTVRLDSVENYTLLTGRSSVVTDSFRQMSLFLKEINSPYRQLIIQVRAFNDGVAFRYLFPGETGDSVYIRSEETGFRITGNPLVHALPQDNFSNAHEGNYIHSTLQNIPEDTLLDLPILFAFPDTLYMAITEAALLDYAGMYLVKRGNHISSILSPRISRPGYAVIARLPHQSPWRVIMISKSPGRFLETNMLTDLAPACRISDLSWLKPGKTTFPWWNGNVTADTLNAPGNNFVTQKYYIDFCARSKIEYHSVVEYGLHQWYQDDGVSFMPGPNSNVLKPVPGLDMKQVCDYAHSQGVGVRVWVHWAALYPKLDSAFTLFEEWGLSGLMVDFMNRDDQEMVNMQTEILQKAAAHHLHIQFHGAYKPTGLSRTYPNEFTREGTLNYEADKWNAQGVTPQHDLDIAFTRLIAGSTDYHLGGFRAVTPDHFIAQYTRPLVLGTRAHMLAMYVVLENANAMICDYPEAYEKQSGFDFLQEVPTVWDETRVPASSPDHYLILARRNKNTWWVGAVNGADPAVLRLSFDFLNAGNWRARIYQDDLNTPFNPNQLIIKTVYVNKNTRLEIPVANGGGFTIKIEKEGTAGYLQ